MPFFFAPLFLGRQCTSGWCPDDSTSTVVVPSSERFICRAKLSVGDVCGNSANSERDFYCSNNKCGQMADNDFRCCSSIAGLGTGQEWCIGLPNGAESGCKHHGQCTSDFCPDGATDVTTRYRCTAKRSDGQSCTQGSTNQECSSGECCCDGGKAGSCNNNNNNWICHTGSNVWDRCDGT